MAPAKKPVKLLEMNTHEFALAQARLCFWPVGTVEAHDQGPLGTDVIAPEKLAQDLAPEFKAIMLPTLPYGLVSSLSGYPGGMWVSDATYKSMVYELLGSLADSGIRSVIIFNGHGGNAPALAEVMPRLNKDKGLKVANLEWWRLASDLSAEHFGSAAGHGGADELAVVATVDASLVPKVWDGSRAYRVREGARVVPWPRSAVRFNELPGKPLTPKTAAGFYKALVQRMREVVKDVVAGWESFERLHG